MVSERVKILIVNTTSFGTGGIRKVIMNFYEKMNKDSLCIDVISISDEMNSCDKEMFEDNNTNIHVFKRRENVLKYVKQLFSLCKKEKYDIIHVHGNSATMAIELVIAKLCGIKKRIAHCHTTQCSRVKEHKICMPFFKKSYTCALACSKKAGDWIFGENQFGILKNAMNLTQYLYNEKVRDEYRKNISVPNDAIVLGHVGYFNEIKNQEFLVDLLKELNQKGNFFLMLIGVGANQEFIKQKVKDLGIADKVLFMDGRQDVNNLLQVMDIFLFPSKWEGLGLALLEAQLSGLNCIASTNVPKETNVSGKVCYVPLSSKNEWLEQILEFCAPINREERGADAYKKMQDAGYDIDVEVKELERIYRVDC